MKTTLAAIAVTIVSGSPAFADANVCATLGQMSMRIMESRIDGERIFDLRERVTAQIDPEYTGILKFINYAIDAAYSITIPDDAQSQAEVVSDFGYMTYDICITAVGG